MTDTYKILLKEYNYDESLNVIIKDLLTIYNINIDTNKIIEGDINKSDIMKCINYLEILNNIYDKMINYKIFNKYTSLIELGYGHIESVKVIEDYLTKYNIDKNILITKNDFKYNKVTFNNDNILNYIQCFEILDYVDINKFIDYIFNNYILKYNLLETIIHLPIIEDKINYHLKNNVCNTKFINYLIDNNLKIRYLKVCNSLPDNLINYLTDINYLDIYEKYNHSDNITNDKIKKFTKLTHLNIETLYVSNEGLKYLPNLTHLTIKNSIYITDEGLKYLPNLTHLHLKDYNEITDDGIKHLKKLTNLVIECNYYISDNGLKSLTNLTDLEIHYKDDKITDEGLKNLTKLTKLKIVANKKITNEIFKFLTNLTHLELIYTSNINCDGLKYLTNLRVLVIRNYSKITKEEIYKVLPNLVTSDIN